jgi:hypothetical protein
VRNDAVTLALAPTALLFVLPVPVVLLTQIHWQYGYVYFWVACVFITAGFSALLQRWGMFEYSGAAP